MESCKLNNSCHNHSIQITSDKELNSSSFTEEEDQKKIKHLRLMQENTDIGIMFASKFVIRIITNPFVIFITNRLGYGVSIFVGLLTLSLSSVIYAIGNNYSILFFSRSLHGFGSAFINTAGMDMLAEMYTNDKERGNAMSIALTGVGVGMLIGSGLGGITYHFMGKAFPFWVLAVLISVNGLLQIITIPPKGGRKGKINTSIVSLIKDHYIIIAAGCITVPNVALSALQASLPIWMMDKMNAPEWQQGVVFLFPGLLYLIGTSILGRLGHKFGRFPW
ncbi:synaptic vesicular amine transporter-like isoform X2 [Centruroides vittatus]|uniref:synaptic vesicular amine transporter-like isoform X2 n=1 Tax=Centruroides vittatus TaxID=120091 RepID=UPI00350EF871